VGLIKKIFFVGLNINFSAFNTLRIAVHVGGLNFTTGANLSSAAFTTTTLAMK
jgi:hypothetical protein